MHHLHTALFLSTGRCLRELTLCFFTVNFNLLKEWLDSKRDAVSRDLQRTATDEEVLASTKYKMRDWQNKTVRCYLPAKKMCENLTKWLAKWLLQHSDEHGYVLRPGFVDCFKQQYNLAAKGYLSGKHNHHIHT